MWQRESGRQTLMGELIPITYTFNLGLRPTLKHQPTSKCYKIVKNVGCNLLQPSGGVFKCLVWAKKTQNRFSLPWQRKRMKNWHLKSWNWSIDCCSCNNFFFFKYPKHQKKNKQTNTHTHREEVGGGSRRCCGCGRTRVNEKAKRAWLRPSTRSWGASCTSFCPSPPVLARPRPPPPPSPAHRLWAPTGFIRSGPFFLRQMHRTKKKTTKSSYSLSSALGCFIRPPPKPRLSLSLLGLWVRRLTSTRKINF